MSDFFDYSKNSHTSPVAARALFSRFQDGDWDKLRNFSAVRRFADGTTIYTAENAERAVYFLSAGKVELVASNPASFHSQKIEISPGSVFGILTFLDGHARSVSAVAHGAVETLMLEKTMFERLAAWHPRIAITILNDLAETVASRLRQHDVML